MRNATEEYIHAYCLSQPPLLKFLVQSRHTETSDSKFEKKPKKKKKNRIERLELVWNVAVKTSQKFGWRVRWDFLDNESRRSEMCCIVDRWSLRCQVPKSTLALPSPISETRAIHSEVREEKPRMSNRMIKLSTTSRGFIGI